MDVTQLKGKTIGFAGSGGLDSCTITRWLADNGVTVVCFTADLAQPDEVSFDDIGKRMKAAGAQEFVVLDAREKLAEAGLKVVQSQAHYEGGYWNTTGIARYVVVQAMIPEMKKRGISILSHGCTGRGNDQVRFQLATNMLAPEFEVYAPWRDNHFLARFRGRSEMITFCEENKIPIKASKDSPYSTDANMLGLTHEAGKLESLEVPASFINPGMGVHPEKAPERPETVEIRFEQGRPVSLNGDTLPLLPLILRANEMAGRNGVGIAIHSVENRFVGIKSRGVYESPAMELLGKSYELLLQLILDKRARDFFETSSRTIAKQIYQGYWLDLATQLALSSVDKVASLVSGTVSVNLYKGQMRFQGVKDVPHSLYSEANSSMEAIGSYDHSDSEGLLRVLGISARAVAAAGQVANK
jgi:argininosuccinate synthase